MKNERIPLSKIENKRRFLKKHGFWKGIGIVRRYLEYNLYLKPFKIEKWFKTNNYKLPLSFKTNIISKGLYIMGSREKLETHIMKKELRKGDICLEAGANIGYYAFLEAKVPSTKIYAFEPDPRNINLLKKGIKVNKLRNIEVIPKALSDKTGKFPPITHQAKNRNNNKDKKWNINLTPKN